VGIMTLDEVMRGDRSERTTLGDSLPDRGVGPVDTLEAKESKQALIEAVEGMPERERTVLLMYYYDELTLSEIGEVLGVTESRVCQIHTKALRQLRSKLADRSEGVPRRAMVSRTPSRRTSLVRRTGQPQLHLLAS
jgi:RNA polymerase sigma factor for flagellar operon FliA